MFEQARDLVLVAGWNELWSWEFLFRYWITSLLSMCTAPSCTDTGTSPRGLMPRNHGWKFWLANRSTRWDSHLMPLRLRKI